MSDFAGTEYDFAAGSLYGLRGWKMDEHGRLHGVTHAEVWLPGENVSTCKQTEKIPCPERAKATGPTDHLPKLSEAAVGSKSKKKKRKGAADDWSIAPWIRLTTADVRSGSCGDSACSYGDYHTVPKSHGFDAECQCGFWAYDEAGFVPQGTVIGVIEAFGKTTIGTKGFRAQKARIVGLCRTGVDNKPLSRSVLARLAQLYPEVMFYDTVDMLVEAHPDVLRQWTDVGEDFWLRPVKSAEDTGTMWFSGPGGGGFRYTLPANITWTTS